tara:strand:+ start:2518 stop:3669 length:1152 start_codon:yes stop_codon:yes gene_type:complete
MKILLIVRDDINDAKTWSGVPLHIKRILSDSNIDFDYIHNLGFPNSILMKIKNRLRRIFKKENNYYSMETASYYGKLINKKLKSISSKFDLIFVIDFIEALPFVETEIPIVCFTDASYMTLNEISYPGYQEFSDKKLKCVQEVEEAGIRRISYFCLSTDWAIESAERYYPDLKNKFFKLAFSSQVYPPPIECDYNTLEVSKNAPVNFLFIGRDWERKGGAKAIKIIHELNRRGINARLIIIGEPSGKLAEEDYFEVVRGCNISSPENRDYYNEIIQNTHFFLLPTKLEAFGLVFVEAMSFKVPSITHNVNALKEVVLNQKTGLSLPLETTVEEFASEIIKLIENPNLYQEMKNKCIQDFNLKYTPEVFIEKIERMVLSLNKKN